MDLFGGVPIATDPEILARPRATRAELFDFLEQELTQARNDLPASWPSNMNGRMTKGAADAILASMYVNAEVFTGEVSTGGLQRGQAGGRTPSTPPSGSSIRVSTASRRTGYPSSRPTTTVPEPILVVKHLNQSGLGWNFMMRTLHYNQVSPSPWNGWSTLADTYLKFDQDDFREDIFLVGPQFNLDTGEPVFDTGRGLRCPMVPIGDIAQGVGDRGDPHSEVAGGREQGSAKQ